MGDCCTTVAKQQKEQTKLESRGGIKAPLKQEISIQKQNATVQGQQVSVQKLQNTTQGQLKIDKTLDELMEQLRDPKSPKIIPALTASLEAVNGLANPIIWKKVDNKTEYCWRTCVYGECGSGKSTLLSIMQRVYYKNYMKKLPPMQQLKQGAKIEDFLFEMASGGEAVTTKPVQKQVGNQALVDTVGLNDPQRTNSSIQSQSIAYLVNGEIVHNAKQGISSFTQCIMPDAGGRIKESQIETMNILLLTLTSLYPGADLDNHPRINVVFTNYSRHQVKAEVDDDVYEGGNTEQSSDPKKLINLYKTLLQDSAYKYYQEQIPQSELQAKIAVLFPAENFYFYKRTATMTKVEILQEGQELKNLIEDNCKHGMFYVKDGQFRSVQLEATERNALVESLKKGLTDCEKQVARSIETFTKCAPPNEESNEPAQSEVLLNIQAELQTAHDSFTQNVEKCPWVCQKIPSDGINILKTGFERFGDMLHDVCQTEILKYNKKAAAEMKISQEKQRQAYAAATEELQKKLEVHKKEEEVAKQKAAEDLADMMKQLEEQKAREKAIQAEKQREARQLQAQFEKDMAEEKRLQKESRDKEKAEAAEEKRLQKESRDKEKAEARQLQAQFEKEMAVEKQLQKESRDKEKAMKRWIELPPIIKEVELEIEEPQRWTVERKVKKSYDTAGSWTLSVMTFGITRAAGVHDYEEVTGYGHHWGEHSCQHVIEVDPGYTLTWIEFEDESGVGEMYIKSQTSTSVTFEMKAPGDYENCDTKDANPWLDKGYKYIVKVKLWQKGPAPN